MGAGARHQRRAAPHAVLLLPHPHGHPLPAVRHAARHPAARERGQRGAAPAQPHDAGGAVPAHAALLRGLPVRQDGGVGAGGGPGAGGGLPGGAGPQERPAPVEAAVRGGALRPHQHGAVGVRPRLLRQDRQHVPRVGRAAGGRPAPGRRLAAAMIPAAGA